MLMHLFVNVWLICNAPWFHSAVHGDEMSLGVCVYSVLGWHSGWPHFIFPDFGFRVCLFNFNYVAWMISSFPKLILRMFLVAENVSDIMVYLFISLSSLIKFALVKPFQFFVPLLFFLRFLFSVVRWRPSCSAHNSPLQLSNIIVKLR